MRRLIILSFFLTASCSADQTIDTPVPVVAAPIRVPETITIGLAVGAPRCDFVFASGATARNAAGRSFVVTEERLAIIPDSAGLRWIFADSIPGPVSVSWRFEPLDDSPLVINGRSYRGAIRLHLRDTAIVISNELDLENYLRGVVAKEIGFVRMDNFEAIKAQAVAARTYAVRNLGRRKSLGFDLFATPDDQVYEGVAAETRLTDSAVAMTAGEILVYGGAVVDAFYHSTCGGRTASMRDIWGGAGKPYLEGVDDTLGDTAACGISSVFRWREEFRGETIITVLEKDSSGRNRIVRIDAPETSFILIGDAIRRGIRRPNGSALRSTMFDVFCDTGIIRLIGGGWGHGIGMCQMGAIGRARAGHDYRSILLHYYPGAEIRMMR